jgi:glycosyltransferase involved in cell wall biosynthesis
MRMKIGYCTITDPRDRRAWSGAHFNILKSLEQYCGDVVVLGPIQNKYIKLLKGVNKITRPLFQKEVNVFHADLVAKEYARQLERKLNDIHNLDIIFAPAAGCLTAYLKTKVPVVSLFDATTKLLLDYYGGYKQLFGWSQKACVTIDQQAMRRSVLNIFSSNWAARSALCDYGLDGERVIVLSFGANFPTEELPTREQVMEFRSTAMKKMCTLLFIGVDWCRKGGEIAYETMLELNERGVEAELIVCGAVPPKKFSHPRMRVIGFLDKNNPQDLRRLYELYKEASFFILPTRAECAGIVFCEASAFGLPILATDTGGVSSYVENAKTGFLHGFDVGAKEWASSIERLWSDSELYSDFCLNARNRYETDLNWDVWGKKVFNLLKERVVLRRC